jgi:transcriptional regulatory protein RtcR
MQDVRRVVIGLLGTTQDAAEDSKRWAKWRPTVSLFQSPAQHFDRLELLSQPKFKELADAVVEDIKAISPETEVRLHVVEFQDPRQFAEVYAILYDFAKGYEFDLEGEEYFVHITTGTHVAQICLYLLTESKHLPAKLVQTFRPYKKKKGAENVKVIDLDLAVYEQIAARFEVEREEGATVLKNGIQTRNVGFNEMIDEIEAVAVRTKDPILLTGRTGSGKSQMAGLIYDLKKSRNMVKGRFVEVNCATLRGDSAMSALFGHVKGAFTGAVNKRDGYLKSADEGVLFLDEIAELGADEQAMLLRAVEKKSFFPVGSDTEVHSDFQIIAGTNRSLAERVAKGEFREDLLSRIEHWAYEMPALKDRREDIEPNVDHELQKFAREQGKNVLFNSEARRLFLDFAMSPDALWTRNFRDLNGAIRRMAALSPSGRISEAAVRQQMDRLRRAWQGEARNEDRAFLEELVGAESLALHDPFDVLQLERVVRVCRTSRSLADAGRVLYSASRERRRKLNDSDRLRKYLVGFGITWTMIRRLAEDRTQ